MVELQVIELKKYQMNQLLVFVVIMVMQCMAGAKYFGAIGIECCSIDIQFMANKIGYACIDTRHKCIDIMDNDIQNTQIIFRDINIIKNDAKTTKEVKTFGAMETEFDVIERVWIYVQKNQS
eukprot:239658_1